MENYRKYKEEGRIEFVTVSHPNRPDDKVLGVSRLMDDGTRYVTRVQLETKKDGLARLEEQIKTLEEEKLDLVELIADVEKAEKQLLDS